MENLTEKVYECTLAVEAHMICDLLSQAGISARVDGEFLQTGAGELPVGNLVKVRVAPTRAAEAREVIAEWEKLQPPGEATPAPRPSPYAWPFLLFLGMSLGAMGMYLGLQAKRYSEYSDRQTIDYDGDGRADVTYYYDGDQPTRTERDRNRDGRVDQVWAYNQDGIERYYESDEDFDGRYEWHGEFERGLMTRAVLDVDSDGHPEQVSHFRNGVLESLEYHFASGGRIVKREFYKAGLLESAEFDDDGDGLFERRVSYDAHSEPRR